MPRAHFQQPTEPVQPQEPVIDLEPPVVEFGGPVVGLVFVGLAFIGHGRSRASHMTEGAVEDDLQPSALQPVLNQERLEQRRPPGEGRQLFDHVFDSSRTSPR